MSTTVLMPLDPTLSPQRMSRVLSISADLLPAEIVSARRARRSRSWVAGALIITLALLAGWYVWADRRVTAAGNELSQVTQEATRLQKSQAKYQDVVDVQIQATTITKELSSLLANDLQWAALLDTLRSTGTRAGVTVVGINAAINTETAASTTVDSLPSLTKSTTVGKITVTGSAPDKPSIAKYVDALSRLTTFANPFLTSATRANATGDDAWQFSITVDISSTALCGRFTTRCANPGGK